MNDRQRVKKLLKELDLTTYREISQILLNFGFDRQRAKQFLDAISKQNLIDIKHNGDIKWVKLAGETILLENLKIGAKMTLHGERYLHENLTFFEKVKAEWWNLLLVNIPGLIIGSLIGFYVSNSKNQEDTSKENLEQNIDKIDDTIQTTTK